MKRFISIFMTLLMLLAVTACTSPEATAPLATEAPTETATAELPNSTQIPAIPAEQPTEQPSEEPTEEPAAPSEPVRVAALTGPTGVGLAFLTKISDAYALDLQADPQNVVAKFSSGEVNIAAVPINLAATLYKKTEGNVAVIAVNTLGVLYFLENGDTVQSVSDLAGKTIYATGQASTPEYILRQILDQNGLTDSVTVEYIAEASALAAQLAEENDVKIAFMPEPMASVARAKSESVRVVLSANDLWKEKNEAEIVQGVYIVNKNYLASHPEQVNQFLTDAAESVSKVLTDENAAAAVVELGIIGQEPIAKRAIPNCNIVLLTGAEMRTMVEAMLQTLFAAEPKSVGGSLPADDFYYVP